MEGVLGRKVRGVGTALLLLLLLCCRVVAGGSGDGAREGQSGIVVFGCAGRDLEA